MDHFLFFSYGQVKDYLIACLTAMLIKVSRIPLSVSTNFEENARMLMAFNLPVFGIDWYLDGQDEDEIKYVASWPQEMIVVLINGLNQPSSVFTKKKLSQIINCKVLTVEQQNNRKSCLPQITPFWMPVSKLLVLVILEPFWKRTLVVCDRLKERKTMPHRWSSRGGRVEADVVALVPWWENEFNGPALKRYVVFDLIYFDAVMMLFPLALLWPITPVLHSS